MINKVFVVIFNQKFDDDNEDYTLETIENIFDNRDKAVKRINELENMNDNDNDWYSIQEHELK